MFELKSLQLSHLDTLVLYYSIKMRYTEARAFKSVHYSYKVHVLVHIKMAGREKKNATN